MVRLTVNDDLTSASGLTKALAAVSDPGSQVLLFGAMPCTGGSAWQRLNAHRGPATAEKIKSERELAATLFDNFTLVAEACRANGGNIAIEWPRGCSYWSLPKTQQFLRRFALENYDFDGCMFGLASLATDTLGQPIKKPWRIASDIPGFANLRRLCTHGKTGTTHARCAGSNTKLTEGYTDELCTLIHRCFAAHTCRATSGGSMPPLPYDDEYVVDF